MFTYMLYIKRKSSRHLCPRQAAIPSTVGCGERSKTHVLSPSHPQAVGGRKRIPNCSPQSHSQGRPSATKLFLQGSPSGGPGGGGWGGLSPLLWIPTPCPEPPCSGKVPAQGTQAEDRTRNCRIFRASSEGGKHRKQRFCGDGFTHLKFPEQTRNSFNPLTPKATVYSFQPRNYDNRAS